MNQIKVLKEKIEFLKKDNSKEYTELYFDMVDLFSKYFKKQSILYIASLENYEILEKNIGDNDEEMQKNLEKLFEKIFDLGILENTDELENNLRKYGYESPEDILIDNSEVIEYAKSHSAELMSGINQTTANQIGEIISDGIKNNLNVNQIALQIEAKFANYSIYRATMIAQHEVATAYSEATKKTNDSFTKKLGIVGWKRAITQQDSNVRESHKINEQDGWIPKNQVFSGTGSDNSPFGIFCRCRVDYSLVNPENGLLYDIPGDIRETGYTDEQIDFFHSWHQNEKFTPYTKKQKELQKKYGYIEEEISVIENWSGNTYQIFTNGFKNNGFFKKEEDYKQKTFNSGIKFLFGFLNKTPNFSGKIYRGHKCYKDEYDFLKSLKVGDVYSNKAFFSSSLSKDTALDFMSKGTEVLFTIKTKKAKSIMDFSTKPAEEELLFLPNQLFIVDKIEKKDKILEIFISDLE